MTQVSKAYPDIKLEHVYVDTCAMRLIDKPTSFDVILTSNLFGDILSDEAAMITGSIGLLPRPAWASITPFTSRYTVPP